MERIDQAGETILALTVEIVASFVSNNTVTPGQLTELIGAVHEGLSAASAPVAAAIVELKPAVPIKKSVTPDAIICLENGKPFKSLKRHLNTAYGMSPAEYRAKWGLPHDYPMVAPNYAATRSVLALAGGLGRKVKPAPLPVKKRGRPRKTADAV